jgi:tryptophan 2,3-dioxygenase
VSLTYSSYLKLNELLSLQQPRSEPAEHDETLFIIIHQVYELWFKQLLHEFDRICRELSSGELWGALASFKRCRMVMKTMVAQLDILETMTPMSFLSFRDRLAAASGFQSPQFRALEFLLGFKRADMLKHHEPNSAAMQMLTRRLNEPSVVDRFYEFLAHRGVEIPAELTGKDVTAATVANKRVQDSLVKIYRNEPETTALLELMTDFDEGLQEWRYRHVKMVERTIGTRSGTGGSPGVEFLRQSLFKPVFPDLWEIRDRL